jgi:hypothetical protein
MRMIRGRLFRVLLRIAKIINMNFPIILFKMKNMVNLAEHKNA